MTLKRKVFDVLLAVPEDRGIDRLVNSFMATLIVLNVAAVVLETVDTIYAEHMALFVCFEIFSVAVFAAEYLLRLWSCTEDPRYAHPVLGRLRYALTPMALIDLASILPSFFPSEGLDLRFVRSVRLLRLARSLKMTRYSQSLQMLTNVARSRRSELGITFFIGAILLVCASSAIYFAEREAQPDHFSSIPASMWWAATTLTTVGYGDVYPKTVMGRLLGSLIAVLGIGLFALPAGILASGFSEEAARRREGRPHCPQCGAPLPD